MNGSEGVCAECVWVKGYGGFGNEESVGVDVDDVREELRGSGEGEDPGYKRYTTSTPAHITFFHIINSLLLPFHPASTIYFLLLHTPPASSSSSSSPSTLPPPSTSPSSILPLPPPYFPSTLPPPSTSSSSSILPLPPPHPLPLPSCPYHLLLPPPYPPCLFILLPFHPPPHHLFGLPFFSDPSSSLVLTPSPKSFPPPTLHLRYPFLHPSPSALYLLLPLHHHPTPPPPLLPILLLHRLISSTHVYINFYYPVSTHFFLHL
ncbi:hypothetical protein Pcinc_042557 [Petrolisthes cinctipes]|uniref:Uncharacterized protein n=1 Tax=Petrolisthes cinctipes TaxID=88211 RepID=A0AAE1EGW3_PETCI|nr:hypothetical protein Pcinc_042557 [Petrolisthes cinctipes]